MATDQSQQQGYQGYNAPESDFASNGGYDSMQKGLDQLGTLGEGGSIANTIIINALEEFKKEKKDRKNSLASHILYQQLDNVAEHIANMERLIEKYGGTIESAQAVLETFDAISESAPELLNKIAEYDGNEGLNRLLREKLANFDPLDGSENGLPAKVEEQVLRDNQGNLVYMAEDGSFYRLDLDENGDPRTHIDPQTGNEVPIRVVYENEMMITKFREQIYLGDPPAIPANRTPLSKDTTNNLFHEHNAWGFEYINMANGKNPLPKPQEPIASIEKTGLDSFVACAKADVQVCTEAAYDLEMDIEIHQEEKMQAEERISELKQSINGIKKSPESNSIKAQKLEEIEQKISRIEQKIEARESELHQKLEDLKNTEKSIDTTYDAGAHTFSSVSVSNTFNGEANPYTVNYIGADAESDTTDNESASADGTEGEIQHLTLERDLTLEANMKIVNDIVFEYGMDINTLLEVAKSLDIPESKLTTIIENAAEREPNNPDVQKLAKDYNAYVNPTQDQDFTPSPAPAPTLNLAPNA